MRVLGTTVLVFEWLVLALGIPVAVNTAGVSAGAAWTVFAVATVLIALSVGTITKPTGVVLGWLVQIVIILSGLVVPLLALLGIIFAGLYYAAIRLSRRVDEAKAAAAGRSATPGVPDQAPVGDTERVGEDV